jgi:hypothetical protein
MIADLKADSSRWDDERRATTSRGQPANGIRDLNGNFRKSNIPVVGYRESTTHQSRQYYGPTEAVANPPPTGAYPPTSAAGGVPQQQVYSPGYGSEQSYSQPSPGGYGGPGARYGAPHQPDNYAYVSGGDLQPDLQPAQSVPRGVAGYPSQPPTSYPDSRGNVGGYYPPPGPQGQASQQYAAHPNDPYYGRQSTYINEYAFLFFVSP